MRGPHPRIAGPSEQSKEKESYIRVGVKVNNDLHHSICLAMRILSLRAGRESLLTENISTYFHQPNFLWIDCYCIELNMSCMSAKKLNHGQDFDKTFE